MAGGNLRKSRRIKARKKKLSKSSHFDSTVLLEQPGTTKILNCTPNNQNGMRLPGEVKRQIVNGRRAGRSNNLVSSDENGYNIISKNSEMINCNAKERKNRKTNYTQYQKGKSNLVLNSGKDLQLHEIDNNTNEKKESFVCDVCSKICLDEKAFNKHMKSHNSNKKFKCDLCEKRYTESCSLKRHKKTHDNDRPFICDMCLKSFRDSSSLIRHQVIHTARQKRYHCSKCEKSFMDKHGLKRHEQVHTGLRPYSCHVCSKSFIDSASLNRHQKIHSGVKNYSCPSCKKRFLEKQSLIRHQRTVCKLVDSTAPMESSSWNIDQSCYSLCSGAEESECSADDKSSFPRYRVHLSTASPVLIPTHSSVLSQMDPEMTGKMDAKANKDLPSLHSLIEKDPNLYSSISELVESIDSYEKLLHLCGERGQNEIDAALAKDAAPLPENLLCFECGELLVEGENFESGAKVFLASSSYRCLSCQEDCDYGEPPVLTPAVSPGEPLTTSSRCSEDYEMKCSSDTQDESVVDFKGLNGVYRNTFPKPIPSEKLQDEKNNKTHPLDATKAVKDAGAETHWADCPTGASVDKRKQSHFNSMTAEMSSVFPCHLCSEVFTTSVFLNQHLKCHSCSPFTCMVCSKSLANSSSLKRHMTMHTGEKPFTCPHCQKQFRDPYNFSKHKKACTVTLTTISPGSLNTPQESFKHIGSNENDQADSIARNSNLSPPLASSNPEAFHERTDKVEMTIKKENQLVSCELCSKEFKNEQLLQRHMSYHSGNPNVTCLECGKSCSDSFSLKRHSRLHTGIRPHICENCHHSYCDSWSLKNHRARGCMIGELKVSVDLLHPCPQCTRVYSEVHFLEEHMKSHKGLLKFQCDICPKKFSEAFNLKRHRQLHMVTCSGCEQEFKDKSSLIEHNKVCPANDKNRFLNRANGFTCPTCGRSYATKSYLERHKKFHSDLKPHVCEVCNKRFSESFRLKRHMKVHSGSKPFTCDGCKKGFSDSLGLKRHKISLACKYFQNKQQSQKEYVCHICNKIFQKNYLLVRHMNVHSLEKPFSCELCGKSYKEFSSLKRHQLVHSGIKTFICSVCGKGFYYLDSLKRHKSGSCGKKSRRLEKYKKSSTTKNNRRDKITNIKSEIVNSRKEIDEGLHQNSALGEQLTLAKCKNVKVKFSKKFPPLSHSSKKNTLLLLHPRQSLRCTTTSKLYPRQLEHRQIKISRWPKQYQCSGCFLSFNRKIYLALHYRAH